MARAKAEQGTLIDQRVLPIFIHSEIDDMTQLTPNAMRVYMHLARRADKQGQAWPSYQSMGDHCFISISANAATRRSFARRAIAELIEAGLIRKTNRKDESGESTSNVYELLNPVPIDTGMSIGTPMLNKHTPMPIDTPMPIGTKDTPLKVTPIEDTPLKGGECVDYVVAPQTATPPPPTNPLLLVFDELDVPRPPKHLVHFIVDAGIADLALWREVVGCWARRNHRSDNVDGMLDWYHDPARFRISGKSAPNGNGSGPKSFAQQSMDAGEEYRQRKEQMKNGRHDQPARDAFRLLP